MFIKIQIRLKSKNMIEQCTGRTDLLSLRPSPVLDVSGNQKWKNYISSATNMGKNS